MFIAQRIYKTEFCNGRLKNNNFVGFEYYINVVVV